MDTMFLPASEENIARAAVLLRRGEVVAFPTETVYGLGANALDERAVRAIFEAKERPADNPLIVHVAERAQLAGLCRVNPEAERLMAAYWPGPLTLLLPKTEAIPEIVTAGLPSVAVRCPCHSVALRLLKACNVPVAAPSANRSGRPSPTTALHVLEDMRGRVAMILDGGRCQVGVESTVLDMTGDTPCILRPGAVTKEMVAAVAGDCQVAPSVMRPLKPGEAAPSPGMRHRHYAPRAQMTVFVGAEDKVIAEIRRCYVGAENACILAREGALNAFRDCRTLSLGGTPEETANCLFARLRETDAMGVDRILAMGWDTEGVGLAVMNRMARAAAFDIVTCE